MYHSVWLRVVGFDRGQVDASLGNLEMYPVHSHLEIEPVGSNFTSPARKGSLEDELGYGVIVIDRADI